MTDIPDALVERMVALVHLMANRSTPTTRENDADENYEARAIAALLPKPIDPDLITAREIAVRVWRDGGAVHCAKAANQGRMDDESVVRAALAALKYARGEKP